MGEWGRLFAWNRRMITTGVIDKWWCRPYLGLLYPSQSHPARTNRSTERSKGCCERVNSGSFHSIILAEFKPKRAAEAWSLDSPVHFISLSHALFLFSAHNSIPSLVSKTALSSRGGIWQQQIQYRSAQRPDRVLLLWPVIKASCCLLENTVVNLCLAALKQDQNNVC